MSESIYIQNGYANRNEYLKSLAEENGVDLYIVREMASMLGESEDFDGLVSSIEDMDMF